MRVAVIFDMDGVIVDNGEFHQKAWKEFSLKHDLHFSDETFKNRFFGRTNEQVLPEMFNRKLSPDEIRKLGNEKEEIYRQIYSPHLKPISGLIPFLEELHKNEFPVGVATSAPQENVDFILEGLGIKKFFSVIVTDSMVSKGKPHPEIYQKAAEMLETNPDNCVVFEDSKSGTKAAWDAGTKVVAITTTLPAEKHHHAHQVIKNFEGVSVAFVLNLLK